MNWQPFNTAPKDWTTIIVAYADGETSIGRFDKVGVTWYWTDSTHCHTCDGLLGPDDPKWWMPLPEAPQ